jgi:hypothetical protein
LLFMTLCHVVYATTGLTFLKWSCVLPVIELFNDE